MEILYPRKYIPTQSKPSLSRVEATFLANRSRVRSVLTPSSNPALSPQPPTARQTLMSWSKRSRTCLRGWKGSYFPPGWVVKRDELANDIMTWVTLLVISLEGRSLVCHLVEC